MQHSLNYRDNVACYVRKQYVFVRYDFCARGGFYNLKTTNKDKIFCPPKRNKTQCVSSIKTHDILSHDNCL